MVLCRISCPTWPRTGYGVDACQFDVDDDSSWLFATSSPGTLPLASQCDHGFQCKNMHRQRMNDPHTKFPPALCTTFANLIVPFASRVFRRLFTLPAVSPADKISTWTPTTLYVGRGGTIAHKTFPASPLGQSNDTAMPSLKIRTSEPSCQRWQARHLVFHCPAHEECHVDALVQTYESEVIIFSEDFTPATLQRNDSRFCHGTTWFFAIRRLRMCAQLRRLACPTGRHQRHFQRPRARHCRDRLQTRSPQRSQGSMGGTKPFAFHAGQAH